MWSAAAWTVTWKRRKCYSSSSLLVFLICTNYISSGDPKWRTSQICSTLSCSSLGLNLEDYWTQVVFWGRCLRTSYAASRRRVSVAIAAVGPQFTDSPTDRRGPILHIGQHGVFTVALEEPYTTFNGLSWRKCGSHTGISQTRMNVYFWIREHVTIVRYWAVRSVLTMSKILKILLPLCC